MDNERAASVVDVVKTETARQTIILVFSVAGAVLLVYVQRRLSDPDVLSFWKMRASLTIKRWSDRQAERFQRLSLRMANVYNGEKL